MRNKPATKKILSIDGGGIRGIIPANILARIERKTNKPIREIFQLIAGTSTGGIICLALIHGLKAEEMLNFYLKNSEVIFKDTLRDDVRDGFGKNIGADYSQKNLERIFKVIFRKAKLKDLFHPKRAIALVPAYDLSPFEKGHPVNFKPKVFNSLSEDDKNELLVNVACRTTAAPTYFPIREKKYIDGGVAINHPAMAAVAFAINNDPQNGMNLKLNELKVLSLGTGVSNQLRIEPQKVDNGDWGNIQWMKYLPDLVTESNIQTSEYYVRQILNFNNDIDKRYLRIQPTLDVKIEIDTTSPQLLNYLRRTAENIPIEPILKFLNE